MHGTCWVRCAALRCGVLCCMLHAVWCCVLLVRWRQCSGLENCQMHGAQHAAMPHAGRAALCFWAAGSV